MFEVFGRHSPMFDTSEVKSLLDLFRTNLDIDAKIASANLELVPLQQTVRIREVNPIIAKSSETSDASAISSLDFAVDSDLFKKLALVLKETGKVDSVLPVTEGSVPEWAKPLFSDADAGSEKPLLVGNASELNFNFLSQSKWVGADLPILLHGVTFGDDIKYSEAFFAVQPRISLEVSLNRFENIGNPGSLLFGMIRL